MIIYIVFHFFVSIVAFVIQFVIQFVEYAVSCTYYTILYTEAPILFSPMVELSEETLLFVV